jgi:hypothetical protein
MNKTFTSLLLFAAWNIPTTVLAVETSSLNRADQSLVASGNIQRTSGNVHRSSTTNVNHTNVNRSNTTNINHTNVNRSNTTSVNHTNVNRSNTTNINHTNVNRSNTTNVNRNNVNINNNHNVNVNRPNGNYNGGNYNRPNGVYRGNNVYINNPRGWSNWGWHGGTAWYPNTSYWGGGFWGAFAVGAMTTAVTGAAISAASQPKYVVVENGTPGYTLLTNYGLTQTHCTSGVVIINGPSNSTICALPTSTVPVGTYTIEQSTLTLIPQY